MVASSVADAYQRQRNADYKRAHYLYVRCDPYGVYVCVYCGRFATCRDHVVPISYIIQYLDLDIKPFRSGLRHVPSCTECNSLLGNFYSLSISRKRAEVKRRLIRKYYKLLHNPSWDENEIKKHGYTLQGWLREKEALKEQLINRLSFPRHRTKLSDKFLSHSSPTNQELTTMEASRVIHSLPASNTVSLEEGIKSLTAFDEAANIFISVIAMNLPDNNKRKEVLDYILAAKKAAGECCISC